MVHVHMLCYEFNEQASTASLNPPLIAVCKTSSKVWYQRPLHTNNEPRIKHCIDAADELQEIIATGGRATTEAQQQQTALTTFAWPQRAP